jgi:hypothetical protein
MTIVLFMLRVILSQHLQAGSAESSDIWATGLAAARSDIPFRTPAHKAV